ncbi:MAG: branched-chain amino acid transporter permease [Clostridia bacterium]|nr:branched-chain amino acid transporter permease [Clostridia bacterium]
MDNLHSALIVAVVALVTIGLRFLPFVIFSGSKQTPPYVAYLGRVLPYAIMGMLVVYCLRNVNVSAAPHGLPELLSCLLVAGLHLWKRNTLISIVGGTACYMLLVQFVFV